MTEATATTTATSAAVDPAAATAPGLWAIVELFGRARIAGRISEQTFGGAHLVRVDVPEVTFIDSWFDDGERARGTRTIGAHTCSYGSGAIYSIQWVDQAVALAAAQEIRHVPIDSYTLRQALQQLEPGVRRDLLEAPGAA